MGPFVLLFADAALGLWYIKATTVLAHSSQLSSQQTAKTGKVFANVCIADLFFYEDKSFWGHCYECSSDYLDLQSYVKQCSSIWVEKGSWMIHENPNYSGHQYFLKKGDYPDFQKWVYNGSIQSNMVHNSISHMIQLYEKGELQGQMLELTDDCSSVPGYIHLLEICFLSVLGGSWLLYEMPKVRGQQNLLKPREYRRVLDWGVVNAKIVSLQRLADLH
ncbi:gamma-crystallin D-like [Antrostomus carolinensis]|uniref:gamma-crystallin D-like n=1 Tax=Antrostomus carolinensis TaxID=279965 RepID=UPI0010A985B8|nr:gamma-crystallin D-like [Antrostomus carolinensis]